jgi:hypothetical protein
MANYGVIDLSRESPVQVTATAEGEALWGGKPRGVDLGELRRQLEEIRDAILPVAETQCRRARLRTPKPGV